ncbi:MAG: heavy-metal-associated domain-containing protein [Deltaproteobacteria bacterium]|nr:heavy-metal-associated domain-containing protein [Deltaproteobacteria bacterium]
MESTVQIKGMSCGHCVKAVDQALRKLDGIKDVKVTIGEAVITTDGPMNETAVREAIKDEGFEVV